MVCLLRLHTLATLFRATHSPIFDIAKEANHEAKGARHA
jgi:hypothetical protein